VLKRDDVFEEGGLNQSIYCFCHKTVSTGEPTMQNHTHVPNFWKRWRHRPTLPAHLPRLLLATRHQPRYVRRCRVTQSLISKLNLLAWEQLPLSLSLNRQGEKSIPLAAYIGAYLVKLDQEISTFGKLRTFLRTHPALVWALGFPLADEWHEPDDRMIEASLPGQQHFSRKLSRLPNEILQTLLAEQVSWLKERLGAEFGNVVSIDTKHILAWVKENNPKAYIKEGRFDGDKQPAGDNDCRVGCKRRKNQRTPTKEGQPVNGKVSVGEFYWGYASGVVATKVPEVGEFVLAELTQTFDKGDTTYFFPLMEQVEARLGCRPQFGTADAAFDAFYIYDYFNSDDHDGFAAIPSRQPDFTRRFTEDGVPLCEAGLPFHQKSSFVNRTSLVQHRRGTFVCPLLHPEPNGESCPIQHRKWEGGGCKLVMPLAAGSRIRFQLDRKSDRYKQIYNQRTAVERIFSQVTALGIERPKLRSRAAITNINTLHYILVNLRAMLRLDQITD